jgi:2-methylcitrate dehydratase PrpD
LRVTQELAKYCHGLKFQDIPEEVIDRVKYLFLDLIGVACRGSQEDSSKVIYRFVKRIGGSNGVGVIIGTKGKAPYMFAAMANGTSAHAIEMDDMNNEASLHPGAVVFPTALATGQMIGANGKRFIEAVVLGYDVMVHLGKALVAEKHYRRGFHPTATCGTFGSSVVCSKMMGHKDEKIASAMGIAGSQAAGSMEFLAQGAWTKRFHPGWAAYSGMIAAQLAQMGFQGPTSIIEGRNGFLRAYSDEADEGRVLGGIGSGFEILHTSVKPHACCRYMQPPIDGILEIVKENNIQPDEVEKVRLGLLRAGAPLIAEPIENKYRPQSIVDAQFSMPFGAAVTILYRKAGLKEFQLSKIHSEEVKRMMKQVECFVDPDLNRTFPEQWCATVKVLMKNGKSYFTKIEYSKGDPKNPLTWEEIIEKFHDLADPLMPKEQRFKIIKQVRNLEKIRDLRKWSSLLLRNH